MSNLKFKNEDSKKYFQKTIESFRLAFMRFIEGNAEESIELIYKVDQSFRQKRYMANGLKYVQDYDKTVKRLMEQEEL